MENQTVYAICRKTINLPGYTQINTVRDLKSVPRGSVVILAGPIPFQFQEKNILLKVAQDNELTLRTPYEY